MNRDRQIVIVDNVIYHADAEVVTWVNAMLGGGVTPKLCYGLAVLADGFDEARVTERTLPEAIACGAYFFDHYDADESGFSDITCAVAVRDPNVIKPAALKRLLDYPFGHLNVSRITSFIPQENVHALEAAQRLGFVVEGVKKHMQVANDGAVCMLGLYRETCRWWTPDAVPVDIDQEPVLKGIM